MEPLAVILAINAIDATKAHALSAMPDAPVQPAPAPRQGPARPLRHTAAAVLHRLADVVEPRAVQAGRPATR
jgi:hypothetical protein